MQNINTYQNFYFVGIGGIGMSALARYFKSLGKRVSGYDKTPTKLTDALVSEGVSISFQDEVSADIKALHPEDTLVIYTPAIKKLKILEHFEQQNFTIVKRAKALGIVTKHTECLAIACTHGKTTTSTLVAHLSNVAGLPFSCFLGGISENFKSNFLYKGSEISIVEADEYDRSFLSLSPDWAIITSIDADHLDIYGDKNHIEDSFRDFAALVRDEKKLFVRKGADIKAPHLTYAVNEKADFYSDNLRVEGEKTLFTFHSNEDKVEFSWEIPGIHNVENATAAIALLHSLGATYEQLQSGISSFKGIKRRYTKHKLANGKIYIDDYAHHPTELSAVISSVRAFSPDKKLLIVFQPHLFSRTRDFADGFAEVLAKGDDLLLLDIYPARELQEDFEGITSRWLLDKINTENKEVCTLNQALSKIKQRDFDVLLTVGAGNIDTLYDPIIKWGGGID